MAGRGIPPYLCSRTSLQRCLMAKIRTSIGACMCSPCGGVVCICWMCLRTPKKWPVVWPPNWPLASKKPLPHKSFVSERTVGQPASAATHLPAAASPKLRFKALLAQAQVILPRVVSAIRKPKRKRSAVHLWHDLAAFQQRIQRQLPHPETHSG